LLSLYHLYPGRLISIESSSLVGPVADSQAETETSRTLDRAEEAMDTVKICKNTIDILMQVMDAVSRNSMLNISFFTLR
jgi:hypothetical protein